MTRSRPRTSPVREQYSRRIFPKRHCQALHPLERHRRDHHRSDPDIRPGLLEIRDEGFDRMLQFVRPVAHQHVGAVETVEQCLPQGGDCDVAAQAPPRSVPVENDHASRVPDLPPDRTVRDPEDENLPGGEVLHERVGDAAGVQVIVMGKDRRKRGGSRSRRRRGGFGWRRGNRRNAACSTGSQQNPTSSFTGLLPCPAAVHTAATIRATTWRYRPGRRLLLLFTLMWVGIFISWSHVDPNTVPRILYQPRSAFRYWPVRTGLETAM